MNEITIVNLKSKERQKLKKLIWNIKMKSERSTNLKFLEEKEQTFLTLMRENKQKRISCFEENKKKKISNKDFEKLMNDYELRGNELDLELNLVEKELKTRKYFFRRLDYLYLILLFYDGVHVMDFTNNDGNHKINNINDIYNLFLNQILEEKKEKLEIEHKIMQHYMIINNMNHDALEENHKFYLSNEDKNNMFAKILENRAKSLEVNNNYKNIDKVNINDIVVNDFFDTNIDNIYEHIFKKDLKVYKKS